MGSSSPEDLRDGLQRWGVAAERRLWAGRYTAVGAAILPVCLECTVQHYGLCVSLVQDTMVGQYQQEPLWRELNCSTARHCGSASIAIPGSPGWDGNHAGCSPGEPGAVLLCSTVLLQSAHHDSSLILMAFIRVSAIPKAGEPAEAR